MNSVQMARRPSSLLAVFGMLVIAGACDPAQPAGVECEGDAIHASTADELSSALAKAAPGACVVVAAGTYTGAFEVPAGVTLTAGESQQVILRSENARPALHVAGTTTTPRTRVIGIQVQGTGGSGMLVEDGGADLRDIAVSEAAGIGIGIRCERIECLRVEAEVLVTNCTLTNNASGLWVSGARAHLVNCGVQQNQDSTLGGAGGWILQGAHVEIEGGAFTGNDVGMVVDGAGTTALLQGVDVSDNSERGVWVQNISGTLDDPALSLSDCTLRANRRAGLGSIRSTGIVVDNTTIEQTALAPVAIDEATLVDVGDGVGLFDGTTQVRMTGMTFRQNARAQVLVDRAGPAIALEAREMAVAGAQLAVVIQATPDPVDVDAALVSVPVTPLLLSDAPLDVPLEP
jgi:hypothetical protein